MDTYKRARTFTADVDAHDWLQEPANKLAQVLHMSVAGKWWVDTHLPPEKSQEMHVPQAQQPVTVQPHWQNTAMLCAMWPWRISIRCAHAASVTAHEASVGLRQSMCCNNELRRAHNTRTRA